MKGFMTVRTKLRTVNRERRSISVRPDWTWVIWGGNYGLFANESFRKRSVRKRLEVSLQTPKNQFANDGNDNLIP